MDLSVKTQRRRQVVDLTEQVQAVIPPDVTGLAALTVLHTTAAVTTANLDPGTDLDLLDALEVLLPDRPWRHPHSPRHAPDHLLASMVGSSITVPVRDGRLVLGTWQRVVLIEFDGPRSRRLALTLITS
jgi:secondary thiamine-phosphate synthase enzyme